MLAIKALAYHIRAVKHKPQVKIMTNAPAISQSGQYLKDLSFENFALDVQTNSMPGIELNANVEIRALAEPKVSDGKTSGNFESLLHLRAVARPMDQNGTPEGDKPLFMVEITYVGRYQMQNVPQAEVEPFLAIEAPRLLFPFVRQIAADAVMQGGLPPLLFAPIDFAAVYQQQKGAGN